MTNSKEIFNNIMERICLRESPKEIETIAYQLLQAQFQIMKTDIVGEREVAFSQWEELDLIIERINNNEPLQYILGQQEFYGRKFHVNPSVMIPRPETEHLVDEVISWAKKRVHNKGIRVIDLGVGSGCIPVTLALELKNVKTYGLDKSKAALKTAEQNTSRYGVDTVFYQCDILNAPAPPLKVDIVVSNPPYITHSEKSTMFPNVLKYEPHEALFVPDDNPLLFYKSIASKSKSMFDKRGLLVVEINRRFGEQVVALLHKEGYCNIALIQDYFGNDRVVRATYQREL